jgi:hypothetical protein
MTEVWLTPSRSAMMVAAQPDLLALRDEAQHLIGAGTPGLLAPLVPRRRI